MRCVACGQTGSAQDKFCSRCGAAIPAAICGSCGHRNRGGAAFCAQCGAGPGTPRARVSRAAPVLWLLAAVAGLAAVALLFLPRGFRSEAALGHSVPTAPTVAAARGLVRAATGGTVRTASGGLSLSVPPGALDQDTTIELTHRDYSGQRNGPLFATVFAEPSGLKFRQPGRLRMMLPGPKRAADAIQVWEFSSLNPPKNQGAEISYFRPVADFTLDPTGRALELPVRHFSGVALADNTEPYVVFDLPGKWLKRGDILITLGGRDWIGAEKGSWTPGHTGLYAGTRDPGQDTNDGETILESTQLQHSQGYYDGVQWQALRSFKVYGRNTMDHVYLGARRPLREPTEEERKAILFSAAKLVGRPYCAFGGSLGTPGLGTVGITCTGLIEYAYQEATSREVVPGASNNVFLLPKEMYAATRPVDSVTVGTRQKFSMAVKGVVPVGTSRARYIWYDDEPGLCDRSVEQEWQYGQPNVLAAGRATFQGSEFVFTPAEVDGGQRFRFLFTVTPKDKRTPAVTKPFEVQVERSELVHIFLPGDGKELHPAIAARYDPKKERIYGLSDCIEAAPDLDEGGPLTFLEVNVQMSSGTMKDALENKQNLLDDYIARTGKAFYYPNPGVEWPTRWEREDPGPAQTILTRPHAWQSDGPEVHPELFGIYVYKQNLIWARIAGGANVPVEQIKGEWKKAIDGSIRLLDTVEEGRPAAAK